MSYKYIDQEAETFEKCRGKEVTSVSLDGESGTIAFSDGTALTLTLDGDCCSHSYFTDDASKDAQDLVGSIVQKIEEVDEGTAGRVYNVGAVDEDSTVWHFLKFETSKGHVTLDWRNDSNGYYDGSLTARVA